MIEREELLLQYLQTLVKLEGILRPADLKRSAERTCAQLERCLSDETPDISAGE